MTMDWNEHKQSISIQVLLDGETMLSRSDWEAAVHEKILLTWMANDVKLIGNLNKKCHRTNFYIFQKLSRNPLVNSLSKGFC